MPPYNFLRSTLLSTIQLPAAHTLFSQITSDDPKSKALVAVSDENNASAAEQQAVPVPYSYPKFHLAFCFASCFLSMQLSSWLERCSHTNVSITDRFIVMPFFFYSLLCSQRQPTPMNTTTPQAWVKVVSAWICSLLYIWTLLAPLLFPHRFTSAHVPYMSPAPSESPSPADSRPPGGYI